MKLLQQLCNIGSKPLNVETVGFQWRAVRGIQTLSKVAQKAFCNFEIIKKVVWFESQLGMYRDQEFIRGSLWLISLEEENLDELSEFENEVEPDANDEQAIDGSSEDETIRRTAVNAAPSASVCTPSLIKRLMNAPQKPFRFRLSFRDVIGKENWVPSPSTTSNVVNISCSIERDDSEDSSHDSMQFWIPVQKRAHRQLFESSCSSCSSTTIDEEMNMLRQAKENRRVLNRKALSDWLICLRLWMITNQWFSWSNWFFKNSFTSVLQRISLFYYH